MHSDDAAVSKVQSVISKNFFPAIMLSVPIAPAVVLAAALLSPSATLREKLFSPSPFGVAKGAEFAESGTHRLLLYRVFDARKPVLPWIMLNPSTADDVTDDHTIRKCVAYTSRWGYGGIVVANLFTFRATSPGQMPASKAALNATEADAVLDILATHAPVVACGWGINGDLHGRADRVIARISKHTSLMCLGVNADGTPTHPAYQPGDAELWPLPARALDRTLATPTHEAPVEGQGEAQVKTAPGGNQA